jgi:hypothetical protein
MEFENRTVRHSTFRQIRQSVRRTPYSPEKSTVQYIHHSKKSP